MNISKAILAGLMASLSAQAMASDWATVDSQVATCGALATLSVNIKTNQKMLTIDNQNCNELQIIMAGQANTTHPLTRGKNLQTSLGDAKGVKLPIALDGQYLVLGMVAAGTVTIQQTDAQRQLTEQQLKNEQDAATKRKVEAAAVGATLAVGAGAVVLEGVSQSEH